MLDFIQRYILNFWVWWYVVAHKSVLTQLVGFWGFMLGKLNVLPMFKNLFQPLFQDYTNIGRIIAFPIRSVWILVGSSIQLIITIPLLVVYVIFLLMPLVPIWAIVDYFSIIL